jgi:hypothetical protein
MKNLRLGCIPILLILGSSLTAQDHGTAFLQLQLMQPDSPALFAEISNNDQDLLKSAMLQNMGHSPVTLYRIGWAAVYGDDRDKVGLGLPVSVPYGFFGPGQIVAVPAQGVSPNLLAEGASAIVFFVAEVQTANGATWKPELEQIEGQARQLVASLHSH